MHCMLTPSPPPPSPAYVCVCVCVFVHLQVVALTSLSWSTLACAVGGPMGVQLIAYLACRAYGDSHVSLCMVDRLQVVQLGWFLANVAATVASVHAVLPPSS